MNVAARSRNERRAYASAMRKLKRQLKTIGMPAFLDRLFGPGIWRYDAEEKLWIVPDRKHAGPDRAYLCVRANGSWFKAHLPNEAAQ
jgi:hypothetical protein